MYIILIMKRDNFKYKKNEFSEIGDSPSSFNISKPSRISPISNFTKPSDAPVPSNYVRSFP